MRLGSRGATPQFDENRLNRLAEVKAYDDLPAYDVFDRGRTIVRNISATRWGVICESYFKGHAFINCQFQDCTFQSSVFDNYFVACKFVNCTFLDCVAPSDGVNSRRLFVNCTIVTCRTIQTNQPNQPGQPGQPTQAPQLGGFAATLLGRQTDLDRHAANRKNIAPLSINQK